MKALILLFSLSLSSICLADTADVFVNTQSSDMIDLLNAAFTKLNITSCDLLTNGRTDTITLNITGYTGPLKLIHQAPVKAGMDKRIVIHADELTGDNPNNATQDGILDARVAAIVEFACNESNPNARMKKGYFVQTGRHGTDANNDMIEAYCDNGIPNPSVTFRIVGNGSGGDGEASNGTTPYLTIFNKNTSTGLMEQSTTSDYSGILSYLDDLGLTGTKATLQGAGLAGLN